MLGGIFNFMSRNEEYKLRKRYDDVREEAVKKKKNPMSFKILQKLDSVSGNLVMFEENRVQRRDKRNMALYIKTTLREAEDMAKKL